ncbi:helix-turn-helix transcriptional regulator [Streptomyces sp. ISL-22]|uniref:helix-turn-helix domain-containing protein n=1 Tax=unclassified Streptomyces TaxID=2593676 RepID=UPI001BE82917|nr:MULTISPECIES: XRE family transcriptional regulator [unclassified Streptomyces]MBT2416370.1 helix-turn-helix transcriptional regulator [Streptomyces sp. ISL-24]MBT2434169.1 helix-turn-helix transcriptional regulator [Streptomyces sp. ISL-22]
MPPAAAPPVGARIRQARLQRGTSLRALAREIGVSASLVSQIENGRSQPSVSTLYAITTALGISVESLFAAGEAAAATPVATAAGTAPRTATAASGTATAPATAAGTATAPATAAGTATAPGTAASGTVLHALAAFAADPGRRIGPVVTPDEREVLELDSGVVWERLGHVPGTDVDFLMVTYRPGGASSSSGGLMRHTGTEYGCLTSGELVLTLGFDEYTLRPGDAVCFESTTPHRYRNDGAVPAVGVWCVFSDT